MRRRGFTETTLSLLLGIATFVVVWLTATELVRLTVTLGVSALIVLAVALLFGLRSVIGVSAVPVLGAIITESAMSDQSLSIRSLVIGCLWFLVVEMGYEALDRRDGSLRASTATLRRVYEVGAVIVVALVVGLVSLLAATLALPRDLVLQTVALVFVLAGLTIVTRHLAG